jgi:hypothetical protein
MGTKRTRPTEWNTLSQAAAGRMLGLTTARVGQLIAEKRLRAYRIKGWVRPRVLITDAEKVKRERERARFRGP